MSAVIKVNGVEVPESLAIVDTLSKEVTLQTQFVGGKKLDIDRIHAEVNLFGDIELPNDL
ncbi:MAG: hypothetical protein NC548_41205 [Lachnospiraceae bacterium]|nr:hypothetical protein [Lachnospiraceae bacterium]